MPLNKIAAVVAVLVVGVASAMVLASADLPVQGVPKENTGILL
jgi:hypothetical protein